MLWWWWQGGLGGCRVPDLSGVDAQLSQACEVPLEVAMPAHESPLLTRLKRVAVVKHASLLVLGVLPSAAAVLGRDAIVEVGGVEMGPSTQSERPVM